MRLEGLSMTLTMLTTSWTKRVLQSVIDCFVVVIDSNIPPTRLNRSCKESCMVLLAVLSV